MANDKETYALIYSRLAIQELSRLDTFWQGEMLAAIEGKLLVTPEIFGKPLRRSLAGCRTLRVGDYRVVFKIEKRTIKILAVLHRSKDYKGIDKRI